MPFASAGEEWVREPVVTHQSVLTQKKTTSKQSDSGQGPTCHVLLGWIVGAKEGPARVRCARRPAERVNALHIIDNNWEFH